jgi:hypothetical protein
MSSFKPMREQAVISMATRGPKWTEDEVRVLTAIYFNSKFSIGDDAQEECQLIADCFGRTPGSVDRQWRNISSTLQDSRTSHVGRLIGDCVREFLDDPAACTQIARATLNRRKWPLKELLEKGKAEGAFQDATETPAARNLRSRLREAIPEIDYRIFPSGSHGYALEVELDSTGKRYQAGISCVLVDSCHGGVVDMKTSRIEIIPELQNLINGSTIKQSPTGRLTMHQSAKLVLHGERFNVSIRANQVIERNL